MDASAICDYSTSGFAVLAGIIGQPEGGKQEQSTFFAIAAVQHSQTGRWQAAVVNIQVYFTSTPLLLLLTVNQKHRTDQALKLSHRAQAT